MLPRARAILWQGAPDWRVLARTRLPYAAGRRLFRAARRLGAAASLRRRHRRSRRRDDARWSALLGVGLLHLLAWGAARTTVYTLTNAASCMRIGIALPKCINLPLG